MRHILFLFFIQYLFIFVINWSLMRKARCLFGENAHRPRTFFDIYICIYFRLIHGVSKDHEYDNQWPCAFFLIYICTYFQLIHSVSRKKKSVFILCGACVFISYFYFLNYLFSTVLKFILYKKLHIYVYMYFYNFHYVLWYCVKIRRTKGFLHFFTPKQKKSYRDFCVQCVEVWSIKGFVYFFLLLEQKKSYRNFWYSVLKYGVLKDSYIFFYSWDKRSHTGI